MFEFVLLTVINNVMVYMICLYVYCAYVDDLSFMHLKLYYENLNKSIKRMMKLSLLFKYKDQK